MANKLSDDQITQAWCEASDNNETQGQLATRIGIGQSTLSDRAAKIRALGIDLPQLGGAKQPRTTVRYDQTGFGTPDWSAEECISQLRALIGKYPNKWITMRFVCNTLEVRDTVFTKHFGTAQEFFRQAGYGKIRQLSLLGKQTAKHVSVDHYRALASRSGYAENYVRENNKRFKTILGANDIHDKDCDPFWRRVFIDTARRVQPDVICFNGDLLDLPEFGKYTVDPRTFDVAGRLKWTHEFLGELREACPDAQLDIIEGNHEFRLVRHMADASPAMMSLLSDLHGMGVADLFGLPKFEANYIAKADLAAYRVCDIKAELGRNWKIYYDCVLANHYPDAIRRGLPGWNGHHHSHKVEQRSSPIFGAYEWHQVGSGHRRDATYRDGENWGNGFILWHVDSHKKQTNAEYIPVTDMAIVGGRYYHRDINECWHAEQALGGGGGMSCPFRPTVPQGMLAWMGKAKQNERREIYQLRDEFRWRARVALKKNGVAA